MYATKFKTLPSIDDEYIILVFENDKGESQEVIVRREMVPDLVDAIARA